MVSDFFWETYSAFANTLGGIILLGVEEHADKSLHPDDLPDPEKLIKDFWNIVNTANKVSANILSDKDVTIENIDGNPLSGSYRRNSEGDYKCTKEEVQAMMRDAAIKTQDMLMLENMELDAFDYDYDSVKRYHIRMKTYRPVHVWEKLEDVEFLYKLGAVGRSGDWSGNVYGFYFRVYNKITQDIKVPFKLGGGDRIDDTPVHKALGEALANCLINADYYGRQGLVIIKKKDIITLSNSSGFRIDVEEAKSGGVSNPRNSTLVNLNASFTQIGVGYVADGHYRTQMFIGK